LCALLHSVVCSFSLGRLFLVCYYYYYGWLGGSFLYLIFVLCSLSAFFFLFFSYTVFTSTAKKNVRVLHNVGKYRALHIIDNGNLQQSEKKRTKMNINTKQFFCSCQHHYLEGKTENYSSFARNIVFFFCSIKKEIQRNSIGFLSVNTCMTRMCGYFAVDLDSDHPKWGSFTHPECASIENI
jgi:hypothetical protein